MTAPAGTLRVAHLRAADVSVVVVSDGGMPRLVHLGAALGEVDETVVALVERPVPAGGLDVDAPLGLVAEARSGWFGRPGLSGRRPDGGDAAPAFALVGWVVTPTSLRASLRDDVAHLALELRVELDPTGMVRLDAEVTNDGATAYELEALRLAVPVPDRARELLLLGGRWGNEFGRRRVPWERSTITVENRRGKTSHERVGAVFAGTPGFGEQHGEVWACHVAWSGNVELTCDAATDARRVVQAGELLGPGEVVLGPGERYAAPSVYVACSDAGLNGISRRFHRFLRSRPNHPRTPRPVTVNTWEAVYFDHDLDTLRALAERAARCGVERFVLDDGWFHGRRHDRAGLGDWWVDETVWPDGLDPIVDHVRALGMQFGLWFEPEMVNPDSDLFRAHPDWALVDPRYDPVLARNQLPLDLGRREVRDHLFDRIDAVLGRYDIAYVKWDMNRDLVAPTSGGRVSVHAQTLGVYELIDRVRAAHPHVEIETCASGGGRVDLAILERTTRVWTSDSNDPHDRHDIQAGFSLLFPPELMGCHIGSPAAHLTGRHADLAFRAQAAYVGSLGIEWNLLALDDDELEAVAAIVRRHRADRDLLHTGDVVRVDHPDEHVRVHGVVAADRGRALFSVACLGSGPSLLAAPVRFAGLDPDRRYRVTVSTLAPQGWGPHRSQPAWITDDDLVVRGDLLEAMGLHPPVLAPDTGVLVALDAC